MTEYVMDYSGWAIGLDVAEYLKVRDTMHSRRREPIVRCRDCVHCVRYDTWNPEGTAHNCNRWGQDIEPDGFCAWGERKEA